MEGRLGRLGRGTRLALPRLVRRRIASQRKKPIHVLGVLVADGDTPRTGKVCLMQINQIMTSSPVTASVRTTIGQAWEALGALEVRHLPIVNEDRELVGIVSDRDFTVPPSLPLVTELLGNRVMSLDAPVGTIMTGAPISVEPDDDIQDAVDLMLENKVGALPVVSPEGRVVGIVSYLDVLRIPRSSGTGTDLQDGST